MFKAPVGSLVGAHRRVAVAAFAAMLLLCGVAAARSEAAVFTPTGTVVTAGVGTQTITLSKTGSPTITMTCTGLQFGGPITASNVGSPAAGSLSNLFFNAGGSTCRDATHYYTIVPQNYATGSLTSVAGAYGLTVSPVSMAIIGTTGPNWSLSSGIPFSASWTNGVQYSPTLIDHSKITLTNALLGNTTPGTGAYQVRVSGQWQIKLHPSGGLITAAP